MTANGITSEIHKTTDYTIFKKLAGNRPLKKRHVNRLVKSIEETNLLHDNPIIVNEKMEVIDGQHRIEAVKILKLPIYYIISKGAHLQDVQLLNTNIEKWTPINYINSYADIGNIHYKVLKDFIETYNLPVIISTALLLGKKVNTVAGGRFKEVLEKGEFVVAETKKAELMAQRIHLCQQYAEYGVYKMRDFIAALQSVLEQVSWDDLYRNMQEGKVKIPRRTSVKEYKRELEVVYNRYKQTNITRFI